MEVTFKYQFLGSNSLGKIYRPRAEVTFPLDGKPSISAWMIIDTGADHTILPKSLADALGISLRKDCTKEKTNGVGGSQSVYYLKKKIPVLVGSLKRDVPLAFFDNDRLPPLLGRLGFLETFDVTFSKNHTVTFKD